jgi:hypothetical protein
MTMLSGFLLEFILTKVRAGMTNLIPEPALILVTCNVTPSSFLPLEGEKKSGGGQGNNRNHES